MLATVSPGSGPKRITLQKKHKGRSNKYNTGGGGGGGEPEGTLSSAETPLDLSPPVQEV